MFWITAAISERVGLLHVLTSLVFETICRRQNHGVSISNLLVLGVARLPTEGFQVVVIGATIWASIASLGKCFSSDLPRDIAGGCIVIGLLPLA